MKLHKNWHYLVVLLLIVGFLLVACERPLPGGYNDPDAGTDTTLPEVPQEVPGIDSESYPSEEAPAAPEEAAPEEAADAAEAYPAEEQEPAPEGEAETDAETPAEEAPVDEAAAEEAGAEEGAEAEEATVEEAAGEEAAGEETAEETADAEESAVEETVETPGTHTVAEGENLYRIGLLYGISWLDLAEANDIVDPANLSVGQILTIPGDDTVAEEAAEGEEATVEEPAAEEAEAVEETSEEAAADEAAAAVETTEEAAPEEEVASSEEEVAVEESAAADGTRTYIVQEGDNLFRIGLNYGVDWTEIAALNGIVNAEIHPGMELIIPAAAEETEAEVEASGETEADAGAQEAEAGEETTYVVQEGDTIYSVAFEHGIPWTAIVESNDIEAPYTLEVGQELIIIVPASGE